jgi:molybdopterin/thiamine biosynthesis adenylyltransferase/proteasome lid subunit RPN8/RPN11
MQLSEGHRLAIEQLDQVAHESNGALIVRGDGFAPDEHGFVEIPIDLDCSDMEQRPGGLELQPREPAILVIGADFPFRYPLVVVPHGRFAGAPHVQWGRLICLYQTSAQWVPQDGMLGLLDRLDEWFARAAMGTLDPAGQPLHAPVAYAAREAGCVVVHPNAPTATARSPWIGAAVLRTVGPTRVDVIGWERMDELWPRGAAVHEVAARARRRWARDDVAAGPTGLGLTVVLPSPISFEFPDTILELIQAFAGQGVTADTVMDGLGLIAVVNHLLIGPPSGGASKGTAPLFLLIGSPMRGIAGSNERLTHLEAWRLPALGAVLASSMLQRYSMDPRVADIGRRSLQIADTWLRAGTTSWARVYDKRPEVTRRRDEDSPANWLEQRRVLVLGCGALGAPIAEQCVRASASKVTVVDNGLVNPGILVRQPYEDRDVGRSKAKVLAHRLRRIGTGTEIEAIDGDAIDDGCPGDRLPDADLVVDATADPSVASQLELHRWQARQQWPALVTVGIGHLAERGVATVSLPGAAGGGSDVLRRLGLLAETELQDELADVAEDLFPRTSRDDDVYDDFYPELGCSAPTFVGSASQVTALASSLLNGALAVLAAAEDADDVRPMSAWVVRLESDLGTPARPPVRLGWRNDLVQRDDRSGYEIRLAAEVLDELRRQCRDVAEREQGDVETGGLLLGELDAACRVVWVRRALPPPADSSGSSTFFRHGVEGIEQLVADHEEGTAATRFIGLWHSHPSMAATPSEIDERAMAELRVQGGRSPSQALLVIVGGRAAWSDWLAGTGRPHVFAQLRSPRRPGGR